jgi:hypothetical protein
MVHRTLFLNTGYLDARPEMVAGIAITKHIWNKAKFVSSDKFTLPDITCTLQDLPLNAFPPSNFDMIMLIVRSNENPYTLHPSVYSSAALWLRPNGIFIINVLSQSIKNPVTAITDDMKSIISKKRGISEFIKKANNPLWLYMLKYATNKSKGNIPTLSKWVEQYSVLKAKSQIGTTFIFSNDIKHIH